MSQKLSLSPICGTWNMDNLLRLDVEIQHFLKLIGFPLTTFLLDYKQHFCIFWFMLRSKDRSTVDMIVTRQSSCGWSLTWDPTDRTSSKFRHLTDWVQVLTGLGMSRQWWGVSVLLLYKLLRTKKRTICLQLWESWMADITGLPGQKHISASIQTVFYMINLLNPTIINRPDDTDHNNEER